MSQAQHTLLGRFESDAPLVCGAFVTCRFHFDVQTPIAPGGRIRLVFTSSPYYHIPPIGLPAKGFIFYARVHFQITEPSGAGYLTAVAQSGRQVHIDLPRATFHFSIVCDAGLEVGDTLTVTIGDQSGGGPGIEVAHHPTYKDWQLICEVDQAATNDWIRQTDMPSLRVVAAPPGQLLVRAPSQAMPGHSTDLHITVTDQYGNHVEGYQGEFEAALDSPPDAVTSHITLDPSDDGARLIPHGIALPASGIQRIVVTSTEADRGLKGVSNPMVCAATPPDYRLLWGDLHGHTHWSDGSHSPEFYYHFGRAYGYLDFCALTDHDIITPAMWDAMQVMAAKANDPGRFTTFLGYEWSGAFDQSIGVLFKHAVGGYYPGTAEASRDPHALIALVASADTLIIRHDMPVPGQRWQCLDPTGQLERLVEIYSAFHTSERADAPYARGKLDAGNSVQAALADGLRFGFIANSDTHLSMPGRRLGGIKGYPGVKARVYGLTAVLATDNTREAIFTALHARRCYAATDRIYLDVRLNGHWMGAELQLAGPRHIQVTVAGTAPLAQVDILKNNAVIQRVTPNGLDTSFEFTDETRVAPGDFYYVRVIQTDGGLAWASPIWVDPL